MFQSISSEICNLKVKLIKYLNIRFSKKPHNVLVLELHEMGNMGMAGGMDMDKIDVIRPLAHSLNSMISNTHKYGAHRDKYTPTKNERAKFRQ